MNILILTNGEYGNYKFCKESVSYDWIICADGGMHHARILDITPDLIVGDFDSGKKEDLDYFKEKHITIETFKKEKDETDTELAVIRAIQKGATKVTIYGGIGSRLDHTLANVQLLYKLLQKGIEARLMNTHNTVYLANDRIVLHGNKGDLVSLIPFAGAVKGVTTTHLAYPLQDAKLDIGNSLGISNYLLEQEAEVTLKEGTLLVICARD